MSAPEDREAVHRILEHEAIHLETLMYLWHCLPLNQKRWPADYRLFVDGALPIQALVDIPGGPATLGITRDTVPFAWDNEMPEFTVTEPSFRIQQHDVTNAQYLDGCSAWGVHDLVGNGWEWTATPFAPFPSARRRR